MQTSGRSTRNSKKAGIGETLMSFQRPSSTPEPSNQPTPTPEPPTPSLPDNPPENSEDQNDPDQPDQPDNTSDHPDQDPTPVPDPDQALARSLELLANKISTIPAAQKPKSNVKPRKPDTFDGTDPDKLETFTFQCAMYVAACAGDFPDDKSRVTFVLSYLKGTPQAWFQSEVSSAFTTGVLPTWFNNFLEFLQELQKHFGPRDPVTDAMTALEGLKYKDSTKAVRYTVDFNRYARKSGWNDQALARQYYKGLPDRLKDEIARVGKPEKLLDLQDLVAKLDQRHWERQSEISRDKKNSSASASTSNNNKSSSSDNRSGNQQSSNNNNKPNNSQQSKNKDQKKPATNTSSSSASATSAKPSALAGLLGPDGKLTPAERKRRMDNNLCLRCSDSGHKANECKLNTTPKSQPNKAKGRAATTSSPDPTSTSSTSGSGSSSGKG